MWTCQFSKYFLTVPFLEVTVIRHLDLSSAQFTTLLLPSRCIFYLKWQFSNASCMFSSLFLRGYTLEKFAPSDWQFRKRQFKRLHSLHPYRLSHESITYIHSLQRESSVTANKHCHGCCDILSSCVQIFFFLSWHLTRPYIFPLVNRNFCISLMPFSWTRSSTSPPQNFEILSLDSFVFLILWNNDERSVPMFFTLFYEMIRNRILRLVRWMKTRR